MQATRRLDRQGLRRRRGGFTLLEVLVTSAVFLIILAAVYLLYQTGEISYRTGDARADVQQIARIALEQVARDIRQAGYFSAAPPSTEAIRIATNDTLSLQGDVDGTGNKYITYALRDSAGTLGTTLYRQAATNLWSGGEPLAEDVSGLKFTYYTSESVTIPNPLAATYNLDSQGSVTGAVVPDNANRTQRDSIRRIKIEMTLTRMAGGRLQTYTATTDLRLRNL